MVKLIQKLQSFKANTVSDSAHCQTNEFYQLTSLLTWTTVNEWLLYD